jgi:hypothetical protein
LCHIRSLQRCAKLRTTGQAPGLCVNTVRHVTQSQMADRRIYGIFNGNPRLDQVNVALLG